MLFHDEAITSQYCKRVWTHFIWIMSAMETEANDAGLTGNCVALVSSTHRSILELQYKDHVPLINYITVYVHACIYV